MSDQTVFAVASGKGGVGKTTTAVNVATAIAGGGYRVAVIDVDLGMANMSGLVSLEPGDATLHEVLAGEADLQDATYEVARGIFAVPSGEELESYAKTDARGLSEVLDGVRDRFDYVFLDVGAGISHETVLPLGLADGVVLIATPEPAAVNDVSKTIDLVDRADGVVEGLVVTRTRPTDAMAADAVAEELGVDLLGEVPEDGAVRGSMYAGVPLVVQDPQSKASIAFRRVAARLADRSDASRPEHGDHDAATTAARADDAGEDRGTAASADDAPAGSTTTGAGGAGAAGDGEAETPAGADGDPVNQEDEEEEAADDGDDDQDDTDEEDDTNEADDAEDRQRSAGVSDVAEVLEYGEYADEDS